MKTRLFNYLITLIIVGLAGWAALFLYQRYIQKVLVQTLEKVGAGR